MPSYKFRRFAGLKRALRKALQRLGVQVSPCNYYASIPSIQEIETSYEYTEKSPPYLDDEVFQAERMQRWLTELIPYAADFDPPTEDITKTRDKGFYWKNAMFSGSDAMASYAFLRRLKPARIVEIGSGFSTLVALAALKANGAGGITCIEPYPRPFLAAIRGLDLRRRRAQELTAEALNQTLRDGDVLFIDSTHTVKTGSDCAHLYLRVLPKLRHHIFVHIHDIFLPLGMPQQWLLDQQLYWTEQYLVMAWMLENPRVSVLFGSAYHMLYNQALLVKLMHGRFPPGGGSLWLEYKEKSG